MQNDLPNGFMEYEDLCDIFALTPYADNTDAIADSVRTKKFYKEHGAVVVYNVSDIETMVRNT